MISSTGPSAKGSWFWLLIAEWFGSGRLPKAPGTFGSLAALPLAFGLERLDFAAYCGITALLLVVGTWAAERASAILGEKDPQSVVIDEVIGVLLAHAFVLSGPLWVKLLAWGLFRLFDIKKPGPIYRVQFLKPNGVGIMADDVLAGLCAGGCALGIFALSQRLLA